MLCPHVSFWEEEDGVSIPEAAFPATAAPASPAGEDVDGAPAGGGLTRTSRTLSPLRLGSLELQKRKDQLGLRWQERPSPQRTHKAKCSAESLFKILQGKWHSTVKTGLS